MKATPASSARVLVEEPDASQARGPLRLDAPPSHETSVIGVRTRSEAANRALSALVVLIAATVVLPVAFVFGLLIRLTSRGPVFYRQVRVGIDRRAGQSGRVGDERRRRDIGGRAFTIYKFRSMQAHAESGSGAVWATRNDPRITPVGRIMRKCRIDELPQFVNVLKGDMNIVGPRPERPSIFARLCTDVEAYAVRQRAKPGITGLAQINHQYDASVDDVRVKVRYDLEYLRRHGVAEDLRIMARTVPVMLFCKGAC